MKKLLTLTQQLQNLNRLKRTGGILALGLPEHFNLSIAEHSYMVAYLAMFFADTISDKENISLEKILRKALTHDMPKSIIGDLPYGSPSWASFWEIDVRKETSKALDKAFKAMMASVAEEVETKTYFEDLTELEKKVLSAADLAAYLVEMLEWKYLGYNHEGWEMIWFNTIDRLVKIELPFIHDLVAEIKAAYKKGTKEPSPFLAQKDKQTNPEHT